MNKQKIREKIAETKREIVNAPKSRFKIYQNKLTSMKRMETMYDSDLSYEDNAMAFYQYFATTFESLRYKVIEKCKKSLLKGLSGRKKLEVERMIYQSTDQSGRTICGSTVERFLCFFFQKAGLKVDMGIDGWDLTIHTQNGKWNVNAKHTVREKTNDNDCPIRICWGFPNNNCAGFSPHGLKQWSEQEGIMIIVHPKGRMDAQTMANSMGLDVKYYSLDAGIKKIKAEDFAVA